MTNDRMRRLLTKLAVSGERAEKEEEEEVRWLAGGGKGVREHPTDETPFIILRATACDPG